MNYLTVIALHKRHFTRDYHQSRAERALSLSEKEACSRFSLSDEREPLNLKKRELELERRPAE
ncbi:Uncharacterized protein APZ42_012556 [Daphnia magna]|uniref:Uncharacterized protein n=1 Tax=Daphnia magna TaxID=35525 RepID=A0A162RPY9_9CRUS|nr:Uncharacterized protein APZ42_012556 [Daphnia magna]